MAASPWPFGPAPAAAPTGSATARSLVLTAGHSGAEDAGTIMRWPQWRQRPVRPANSAATINGDWQFSQANTIFTFDPPAGFTHK
jgi:hypothetical protein